MLQIVGWLPFTKEHIRLECAFNDVHLIRKGSSVGTVLSREAGT
jgi:hypothetical protein